MADGRLQIRELEWIPSGRWKEGRPPITKRFNPVGSQLELQTGISKTTRQSLFGIDITIRPNVIGVRTSRGRKRKFALELKGGDLQSRFGRRFALHRTTRAASVAETPYLLVEVASSRLIWGFFPFSLTFYFLTLLFSSPGRHRGTGYLPDFRRKVLIYEEKPATISVQRTTVRKRFLRSQRAVEVSSPDRFRARTRLHY